MMFPASRSSRPQGRPSGAARSTEEAIAAKARQDEVRANRAIEESTPWRQFVADNRPALDWYTIAFRINQMHRCNPPMTLHRVADICRRLVALGILDPSVMDKSTTNVSYSQDARDFARRLADDEPKLTLLQIGRRLGEAGHRPMRAGRWTAGSVLTLLSTPKPASKR